MQSWEFLVTCVVSKLKHFAFCDIKLKKRFKECQTCGKSIKSVSDADISDN